MKKKMRRSLGKALYGLVISGVVLSLVLGFGNYVNKEADANVEYDERDSMAAVMSRPPTGMFWEKKGRPR